MVKKLAKFLFAILMAITVIQPLTVKAADLTVMPDSFEVEVGRKVTYTVTVTNGYGEISVDGQTVNFDSKVATTKTFDRSYSAPNQYAFEVKGELTDYTTGEKKDFYDKAVITVVEEGQLPEQEETPTPDDNESGDNDESIEVKKSDEARLSSLIIKDTDGSNIDIYFASEIKEYTIHLTNKDTHITIGAEAWDEEHANVEGTGKKTIEAGENKFEIVVTAEDGKSKETYTIIVNVEVVPITYLNYDGKEYGLMEKIDGVTAPEGFTKTTVTINQENVEVFVNDTKQVTLVYGIDQRDNGQLFLYSNEEGIIGEFIPLKVGTDKVYIIDIPATLQTRNHMTFKNITITDTKVDAWIFDDEQLIDYILLYVLNEEGQKAYYVYDARSQALLEYPETEPTTAKDFEEWLGQMDNEKPNLVLYGSIGVVVLVAIGVIFWMIRKNKKEDDFEELEEVVKPIEKSVKTVIDKFEVEEVPMQGKFIETDLNKVKASKQETTEWLSEDFYKTIIGDEDDK